VIDGLRRNPKLLFRFEGTHQKILRSRGVDGMCFAGTRNAFDFDLSAVRIKPDIPGVILHSISIKKQIYNLIRMLDNPLYGHPIVGVGSFPSDLRAKMIALNIMAAAVRLHTEAKTHRIRRADYPFWHKVYGGFKDVVRDEGLPDRPSLLVISNVDIYSTPVKVEKVRDILEQNPNIPRVVVVAGCDPVTFFATKLHLPLDYGFYVGPGKNDDDSYVLDI
jgi:hypothetical protein